MKKQFLYAFIIAGLSIVGCKKSPVDRVYTISGRLLESSSNPMNVTGYSLTLRQGGISGLFGNNPGVNQSVITDNDGKFMFSYSPKKGNGDQALNTNTNSLYITSFDTLQHKNLNPEFNPITVKVDTNFNTFYLYKKIDKVVRKVLFNTSLSSGDSLLVQTTDAFGAKLKTLFGPILSGTNVTVDTINNYKLSVLNLQSKKYTIFCLLKNKVYSKGFNIDLEIGDENFREIQMTY